MTSLYLSISKKKKIYYSILNRKSKKPPLVFLHGLGADSQIWNKIIPNFKNYPLLLIDFRGHGKSQILDSYKLEDFAQDLNSILNKEKIKKTIFVGHSLGGMISLIFYKLHKSKVKKLILINTTYKDPIKTSYFKFLSPLEIILKKIPSKSVQFSCIQNMINYNVQPFLKSITVPTLIIASKYDELFPTKIAKEMHKYIKTSKLKLLKTTHMSIIRKPNLVSKEMHKFIKN